MNKEQLAALRKLAEEATPGPWNTYINTMDNVIVRKMHETGYEQCVISYKSHYKNANYIAAYNPSTILQLLDYIETLDKDAARYRWMRANNWFVNGIIHDAPYGRRAHDSCEHLDAVIDAAMQGETK